MTASNVSLNDLPSSLPMANSRWKHFKGGLYEVIGTALHSETGEKLILYRQAPPGPQEVWARPTFMWNDEVSPGVHRFEPVTTPSTTPVGPTKGAVTTTSLGIDTK